MKKAKNKLTVIIIILSVCFLILIGYSIQRDNGSFVQNGLGSVINSIQSVFYKAGNNVKQGIGFIFSIGDIKNENERLKEENQKLKNNQSTNKILSQENSKLRSMLDFKERNSQYSYIGADIVGLAGDNFLDGFTINRGEKDGLKKGMVAINGDGLIGQVTSVGSNWAVVQTLSNENVAVAGYVINTKETDGIVKGYKGKDNAMMAQISGLSLKSEIKEGDEILTSGLGGVYPKGIKIGRVIKVNEDKINVVKNAIIQPYVEFNKIDNLLIVVPTDSNEVKY